jgi:hypothetical protein
MTLTVTGEERDEEGLIQIRLELALMLMTQMQERRTMQGEMGMDEEIVLILLRSALDML